MSLPWLDIDFRLLVVVQSDDKEECLYFFESNRAVKEGPKWKLLVETTEWPRIWPLAKNRQVALLIFGSGVVSKNVHSDFIIRSENVEELIPSIKFEEFVWQKENRIGMDSIVRCTRVENVDCLLKKCQDHRMLVSIVVLKGVKELEKEKLLSFDFSNFENLIAEGIAEVKMVNEDFINVRRIRKLIIGGCIVLLALLIANFGIRFYIEQRFQSINEQNDMIGSLEDSLSSGQNRLAELTNMIGNQDIRSIYASRYIDQLTINKPAGMHFDKIAVFPVNISNREENELVRIDVGKIQLYGGVMKSETLEGYIAEIKKLKWIERVRIATFESALENDMFKFELFVQVK